ALRWVRSACLPLPMRTAAGAASTGACWARTVWRFTRGCAPHKDRPRQQEICAMFTGIITDIGTIRSIEQRGDLRVVIDCDYDMESVAIGASIACSGACLTVVAKDEHSFAVDLSAET